MAGSFDPRAYDLEWAQSRHASGLHGPVADPTGGGYQRRKEDARRPRLCRGVVVDTLLYIHAYRVHFEDLAPPLICTMGSGTSLLPIGARQTTTLSPGTPVWVLCSPQLAHGVIVAAEPAATDHPALALSDWVHMASRCGLHVDRAHEAVFRSRNSGTALDWACGRPLDSLPGDFGAMAETGLRIHLDSFMAQVAADEASGLFVFYHDQLVRLAGPNLEQFSAGHVDRHLDDEGEILIYRGWTPYPWEQLGALGRGVNATRSYDAADVQNGSPQYATREPKQDDQVPVHRRVFLGGYLGQAGKDLVVVPPRAAGDGADVLRQSTPAGPGRLAAGVLEEQRTLAGAYLLRSSRSVHILKQGAIPAPHPVRRPEDLDGDSAANYRPAGGDGAGAPHKVAAAVATTLAADSGPAGLQRVAGLLDEIAMRRNWEGEHAIAYHAKDWHLGEEEDAPVAEGYEPPDLSQLGDSFTLPDPPARPMTVDDRYGAVDYRQGEASWNILDDGSIVFRDAWGSQLVMSHGNINLEPAGDLHIRAGRNVVVWAGRDAIVRARGSVEASTSSGDMRLKAERNLHVLAGNSGTGGLLLESRGLDAMDYKDKVGTDVTSGGIQIKATNGSLSAWAQSLYLRSLDSGAIFLDADRGNGALLSLSMDAKRYCVSGAADYFGQPGAVTAANVFGPDANRFAGNLAIGGGLTAASGILSRGDVNIVQGNVYSEQARAAGGVVGDYGPDASAAAAYKDAVQVGVRASKRDATDATKAYTGAITSAYYGEAGPGADAAIARVAFSFRDTKQYRAADFVAWETSWQQLLREAGTATDAWAEPVVSGGGKDTLPYPGLERMAKDRAFLQQPLSLYDLEKGVAKARGTNRAAYEEPKFAAPVVGTLQDNYVVIDATGPNPASAAGGA